MSVFRIADLNIKIDDKFKYTNIFCKDYLADNQDYYDFCASANSKDYENDRKMLPNVSNAYLETLSVYKYISNKLIDYNGFVLHASIIERNGVAYAISANSGVGKTTHSRMWLKVFDDAKIINGDKPLVRLIENEFFAYGTPWCGKENYNENTKCKLGAICFIERGEVNTISEISKIEAVKRIYPQLLIPENSGYLNKLLDVVEMFVERVPAYVLRCNISEEAAIVAYNKMSQEL